MAGRDGACIFCRIIDGSAPAWVVYEDADAIAFLDSMPIAPGHILVCPKEHAARLSQMTGGVEALNLALARVARLVEERISTDYNIGANQGARAGQVVFHHHWHVIPRREGDHREWGRERLTPEGARAVFEELGMEPVRRPPGGDGNR
jgi:diadenosine tetraphosphate (Ap4A) HIT family hydrolase